jgi:hypothetical protein
MSLSLSLSIYIYIYIYSSNRGVTYVSHINSSELGAEHRCKYTLIKEAPVANFFPSFFDTSLSLTPKISGKNIRSI